MRDTSIVGIGQVPVGEHWDRSLRDLGTEAVLLALQDAQLECPEALYVGNMLSGQLSRQQNLGALIADYSGFRGIEALKVEAAGASGAAALRLAYLAVAGGTYDVVVAGGVAKMTEASDSATMSEVGAAADAIYEGEHGASLATLNALMMRRYMHEYGYERADFFGFVANAHRNAVSNPFAMFRRPVSAAAYERARMVADPLSLLDLPAIADGAAAVVLVSTDFALHHGLTAVRIAGSAVATDSVALHDRHKILFLQAASLSAQRALAQAGVKPDDVDLAELHDISGVMAALSLEAIGFAPPGDGVRLAMEDAITLSGRIPISTLGGLKARGHPMGATGLYQVVEVVQQLRGDAGQNQLQGCRLGMTQSIGGTGAVAITHVLERTT